MSAYDTLILGMSGLVAYYELGETPAPGSWVIHDSGPNGANSNSVSGTSGVAAVAGLIANDTSTALQWAGTAVPGLAQNYPSANAPFSIVVWVNISSINTTGRDTVFAFGGPDDNGDNCVGLTINGAGHLTLTTGNGLLSYIVTSPRVLSTGVVYNLGVSWDGSTAATYEQGVQTATASHSALSIPTGGATSFTISQFQNLGSSAFHGISQKIAIFNRVLSDAEWLAIWNTGAAFQQRLFPARFRLAAGMTPLTLYGLSAAASTLPQAGQLGSVGGGSSTTTQTTRIGQATGYGEIAAQGTTQAWPSLSALGRASGKGFLFDVALLDLQQINAGTWTPTVTLSVSAGSINADLYCRFWLWADGPFVPVTPAAGIAGIKLAGQAITTTPTLYAFPATVLPTRAAGLRFLTGNRLYMDVWANITSNETFDPNATLAITVASTSNGVTACQINTPGFQPLSASQRATLYAFGNFCLNDGAAYLTLQREWSRPETKTSLFPVSGQPGAIPTGYKVPYKHLNAIIQVLGNGIEDTLAKLDALWEALHRKQQPLLLSAIDGRYHLADALKAPWQFPAGKPHTAKVPVSFIAANPYSYANWSQSYSTGARPCVNSGAGTWQVGDIVMQVSGTAPALPTITITNNTPANQTTLTSDITMGNTYTSLAVAALPEAVLAGDTYLIGTGATALAVVASANVSAGGTSIPVVSFVAGQTWPSGSPVARSIAITQLLLAQQTNATQLEIDVSASAAQLGNGDYLTIVCDPFAPNGETVTKNGSATQLPYTFQFPNLQPGGNRWAIQVRCASAPVLTAQFSWVPRYQA